LRRFSQVDVRGALVLFLVGFVKKACIADGVAPTVDRYFDAPANYSAGSAWLAVLFYAIQIYGDFSGYTDMAIASAQLLGYELPINFRFPYLAQNVADFWHRWHISLSSWLRDYLYIPLGGNRGNRWFVARNIMITMLLGGLWHGGAWTFVIWGGLHGVALVVHRQWAEWKARPARLSQIVNWIAWPLTAYWICFTWIFFRAANLDRAGVIAKSFVFWKSPGTHDLGMRLIWVVVVLGIIHQLNLRGVFSTWWRRGPVEAFAAGYGCSVALVLVFIPAKYTPFIYFQF
jgi:alginate O-acetyltransferase complex protein AlgI